MNINYVQCFACDGQGVVDTGAQEPWGGFIELACADCSGTGAIDESTIAEGNDDVKRIVANAEAIVENWKAAGKPRDELIDEFGVLLDVRK